MTGDLQELIAGFFAAQTQSEEDRYFGRFVNESYSFALVIARRVFNETADCEDCLQEAYIRLHRVLQKKKNTGEIPENIKGYLARTVQNVGIDKLRKAKKFLNGLTEPLEIRHERKVEDIPAPEIPLIGLSTYFPKDMLKSVLLFEWLLIAKDDISTYGDLALRHKVKYHKVTERMSKGMLAVAKRLEEARNRPRPLRAEELEAWLLVSEEQIPMSNDSLEALGKLIETEDYKKVNQRSAQFRKTLREWLFWWRSQAEKLT